MSDRELLQPNLTTQPVIMVPIASITSSVDQPRQMFDDDSILELAIDIVGNGIINPIIVLERIDGNDKSYVIVAGERRYRAANIANLLTIPVRIVTNEKARIIQLSENLQREDLAPIEIAEALKALKSELGGATHEKLADHIQKSSSYVGRYLLIADAPEDVKAFVKEHSHLFTKVSESGVAKESDEKKRKVMLDKLLGKVAVPNRTLPPGRPPIPFTQKHVKNGFNINIQYRENLKKAEKETLVVNLKKIIEELEKEINSNSSN